MTDQHGRVQLAGHLVDGAHGLLIVFTLLLQDGRLLFNLLHHTATGTVTAQSHNSANFKPLITITLHDGQSRHVTMVTNKDVGYL